MYLAKGENIRWTDVRLAVYHWKSNYLGKDWLNKATEKNMMKSCMCRPELPDMFHRADQTTENTLKPKAITNF